MIEPILEMSKTELVMLIIAVAASVYQLALFVAMARHNSRVSAWPGLIALTLLVALVVMA